MLPSNGKYAVVDYDYHIRNDEVRILRDYIIKTYGEYHWTSILFDLVWTRGLRISEALWINFEDFPIRKHGDFSRLNFREAKTNKIRYNELICEPVAKRIGLYFMRNPAILSHCQGYMFPRRNGSLWKGQPVIRTETAGAYMCKFRNGLGSKYPMILDRYDHQNWNCATCGQQWGEKEKVEADIDDFCQRCGSTLYIKIFHTYRVGWHSLRRNFEDNGLDYSNDNALFVKEMMHYSKVQTVMHYTSKRRLRQKVPDFFSNCITPLFNSFSQYDPNQTKLSRFVTESEQQKTEA